MFIRISSSVIFTLLGLFSTLSQSQAQKTGFIKYEFVKPSQNGRLFKNSILYFNNSESLFVYNKLKMMDSTGFKAVYSPKGFAYHASSADEKGFLIYRNFQTKEIQFRFPEIIPLEPFTVKDKWVEIDWDLKNEHKTIQGYSCQKAIGEFRGRTYKVWYTKEIPFSYGPWKLFGLPGLILEGKDTRNQVRFILKEVCHPCEIDIKIKKPLEKKHKNIKEYVHYLDYLLENVEADMQATLDSIRKTRENFDITITLDNPTTKRDIKKSRKHRMEIKYGWEEFPGDTPNPFNNQGKSNIPLETVPKNIPIEAEN